ncbi:ankyrin repeat domain-containing protein [Pseudanabaenaceae cyanobacterium LEGE 13415]|nr:ankyrin repeat domain-containing protein [Pseudanabaenaceae cyanobacterium LEGE 13415]
MTELTQLNEDLRIILEQDLEPDNPRLHLAIAQGDFDQVHKYVMEGDSLEEIGLYGSIPLEVAARHGHLKIVQLLVERGATINPLDIGTSTPLHEAVLYSHYEVALFLIQSGADVNSEIEDDETPLIYIAALGTVEMAELLVQSGANINASDRYGTNAIIKAAKSRNQPLLNYLSCLVSERDRYQAQVEGFIASIKEGDLTDVTGRISNGMDINAISIEGWTALMHSAYENQILIGRALVEAGADLNLTDEFGQTALVIAQEEGHNEFAQLLRRAGVNQTR